MSRIRNRRNGLILVLVGGVLAVIAVLRVAPLVTPAPVCASEEGLPVGGTWTTGVSLPTIRAETSATALDGRIYVGGGMISGWQASTIFEIYDTETDTWQEVAPMPVAIHHAGVGAANGRIYVTGGYDDMGKMVNALPDISMAWVYDPTTDTWSSIANMPAPRAAHAMVTIDDQLFVVGGTGEGAAAVWVYDPISDSWDTSRAPMPTLREHVPAVVADGRIYVIGGRWEDVSSPAVEAYDPQTDRWERLQDLPTPRSALSLGVINGIIHTVGGEDLDTLCTYGRHEVYDPETDTWTTLADIPTPRHAMVSATVGERWYLIGGASEAGPRTEPSLTGLMEIFTTADRD